MMGSGLSSPPPWRRALRARRARNSRPRLQKGFHRSGRATVHGYDPDLLFSRSVGGMPRSWAAEVERPGGLEGRSIAQRLRR